MTSSETQITNLVYSYAEYADNGEWSKAAALFEHADVYSYSGEGTVVKVDSKELEKYWLEITKIYNDGPRTQHIVTNPIVEVDEVAGTGTCRSYHMVFQQTDDFPLQPILGGRYDDRFERVDGKWRFSYRDWSFVELTGDMSRHSEGDLYLYVKRHASFRS